MNTFDILTMAVTYKKTIAEMSQAERLALKSSLLSNPGVEDEVVELGKLILAEVNTYL